MRYKNVKFRLGLLISIIILPSLIFFSFTIFKQYQKAREIAVSDLTQVARMFSAEQSQTVEGARQLLIGLSITPSVRNMDPQVCTEFLGELIKGYRRYANFGVANARGDVVCSAVSSDQKVNVGDREFFKKAYDSRTFAVGEYQIGQITKKSVLNFGYPIIDLEGNVVGVVFSSLDLSWVSEFISHSGIAEGGVFLLLDKNGSILARSPDASDWVGRAFPNDPLVKKVINNEEGMIDVRGVDGVRRLYAFRRLSGVEKFPTSVVVGIPYDTVFEDANVALLTSILVLMLTTALVIFVSWKIGNLFVVRQVEGLQELDRQKTEFVTTASHQLRTPLSGMKMYLELLIEGEGKKLSKKQAEMVRVLDHLNERTIVLVDGLLSVSRIELGRLKVERSEVLLDRIMSEAIKGLGPKIVDRKLTLSISGKKKLVVQVDEKLVTQAFVNLIDNAIKYSPVGGRVDISVSKKGMMAMVKIKDKGLGISKKEKGVIFQKFRRGENVTSRGIEGNGLGLFIAKSFIEASCGSISFVSRKNYGTTFSIMLPLYMV